LPIVSQQQPRPLIGQPFDALRVDGFDARRRPKRFTLTPQGFTLYASRAAHDVAEFAQPLEKGALRLARHLGREQRAADLEAEYFDAGSWADGDVSALGITAADLASCITLLQQIDALMSGSATSVAAYRATLNKVRRIA